jgi:hypothetical protein
VVWSGLECEIAQLAAFHIALSTIELVYIPVEAQKQAAMLRHQFHCTRVKAAITKTEEPITVNIVFSMYKYV